MNSNLKGNIRKRILPAGWYPDTKNAVQAMISSWIDEYPSGSALAGIVPHAGWEFCGSIMARGLASLACDIDTVVVLGGHNPPGGAFISYKYDLWETPTGVYLPNLDLMNSIESSMDEIWVPEEHADNTVEVVLVMALALKLNARWAAWRVPADARAIEFGQRLAAWAKKNQKTIAVVGSTDLTHYGPRYAFNPPDSLKDPVEWVRDRDRKFLKALLEMDGDGALEWAGREKSACSAGGAVAAMSYAGAMDAAGGRILTYGTSCDVYPDNSFVGYASLIWE